MRHSPRLQSLLLPAMTLALAAAAAAGAARGGTALLAVAAAALIIGLAAVAALPPEHVLLAWLAVAPFVQGTIGSSGGSHALRVAVYSMPPLLFAFWTFTRWRRADLTFIDALPLLYLVLVIISARAGEGHPTTTQLYSIVGVGVIVYFFLAFGPVKLDVLPRIAQVLLITGCLSAAWVLISRATGIDASSSQFDPTASTERAAGTFGSPGALGTYLGIVLVLALAMLVWGGPREFRRLCLLAIVISIPALALTLTRGPLIATGAVALLILVLRGRTRWRTVLAVGVLLIALSAEWGVISSTHLYKTRFSDTANVHLRTVIDQLSVNLAERKPVFGWGYGSFDVVKDQASFNPAPLTRTDVLKFTSHNTFLTILAETGIVGLCVLVLPWLVLARRTLVSTLRDDGQRWILVALLSMLAVWIISAGTFDIRFFSLASAVPWLVAGMMRLLDLERQTGNA